MSDRRYAAKALFGVTAAGLLCVQLAQLSRPVPAAAFVDKKAAGAELFATRGCTHCHGASGEGTDKGPALRDVHKRVKADRIHDQIVHGGQGMPAFGDVLQPAEVDELVSFLRAKKWTAPADGPKPATPPAS